MILEEKDYFELVRTNKKIADVSSKLDAIVEKSDNLFDEMNDIIKNTMDEIEKSTGADRFVINDHISLFKDNGEVYILYSHEDEGTRICDSSLDRLYDVIYGLNQLND